METDFKTIHRVISSWLSLSASLSPSKIWPCIIFPSHTSTILPSQTRWMCGQIDRWIKPKNHAQLVHGDRAKAQTEKTRLGERLQKSKRKANEDPVTFWSKTGPSQGVPNTWCSSRERKLREWFTMEVLWGGWGVACYLLQVTYTQFLPHILAFLCPGG